LDPLCDGFSCAMGKLSKLRLRASRADPWRFGTAGLLGLALATAAAACTGTGSSPAHSAYPRGCSKAFRLKVSANSASPGQVLTVSAEGRWRSSNVETESYGLLGTVRSGRFTPIYNLAAIVPGLRQKNIPVGPSGGVGGVGLGNQPFRIKVPPVHSGSYVVQFLYSVPPTSANGGPKTYNLCALLHISL
jgi:hypothetical protein